MISAMLNLMLLGVALDPYERFRAMRELDSGTGDGTLLTNKWFVLLNWSVVFILGMIFIVVRYQRAEKEKRKKVRLFEEKASLFGLTPEERDILYWIAKYARLKQFHTIYFLPAFFEDGATRLLRKNLISNPDAEFKKQLLETLESIKHKVGFLKKGSSYTGRHRRGRYLTSRQIPVGSEVAVVDNRKPDGLPYQAEVLDNQVTGLRLRCTRPVPFQVADSCTIRLQIGSVLWGFDVLVLSQTGDEMEISHVDHARYINRRRFVRIAIQKSVWVAPFPVLRDFSGDESVRPVFVQAVLLEFSGPSLRIQLPLEVHRRDRLLVIFELPSGRLVQDIAEVQRMESDKNGMIAALELVGLDDRSEDELVRITNQLAVEQGMLLDEEGTDSEEEMETVQEGGGS